MSLLVRAALKHRANVRRATTTDENGVPQYTYSTVATEVPCLLSRVDSQGDELKASDRVGTLLAICDSVIQPGDYLDFTRGPVGRFKVLEESYRRYDLYGISHLEFRVSEVPS